MIDQSLFYQYQRDGVSLSIAKGGRVIIADDMGLGKTPQGLAVVEHYDIRPLMIITPAGLRLNWKEEILKWSPEMFERVHIVSEGTGPNSLNKDPDAINIISYGLASKLWEVISRYSPKSFIADESQALKSPDAKQTKRIKPIFTFAKVVVLLSGTPMDRPRDLYCQLQAVGCPNLPNYYAYAHKFCAAKQKIVGSYICPKTEKRKFKKVLDTTGVSNEEGLNKLIAPVLVRRLKRDVEMQLPEKRRAVVHIHKERTVEAEESIRNMCRQILRQVGNNPKKALNVVKRHKVEFEGGVLEAYRQVGVQKVPVACEIIEDGAKPGNPLVVYAHNREVLIPIFQFVSKKTNLRIGAISGRVDHAERHRIKESFQNGDLDVLLLSIQAAYSGLTLTAASNMLMVQIPWLATIALQCEDRIHRIGQKSASLIRYLVANGTFDSNLWRSVEKRSENISNVLDGGDGVLFKADQTDEVGEDWGDLITQIMNEESILNGN